MPSTSGSRGPRWQTSAGTDGLGAVPGRLPRVDAGRRSRDRRRAWMAPMGSPARPDGPIDTTASPAGALRFIGASIRGSRPDAPFRRHQESSPVAFGGPRRRSSPRSSLRSSASSSSRTFPALTAGRSSRYSADRSRSLGTYVNPTDRNDSATNPGAYRSPEVRRMPYRFKSSATSAMTPLGLNGGRHARTTSSTARPPSSCATATVKASFPLPLAASVKLT